jgi:hypothetical protein
MLTRITTGIVVAAVLSTLSPRAIAAESKSPGRRKSFAAVGAEVQSLKVEKTVWREVQWKTCLLDALKASRGQKKPLMLWIFIDRPIDDERC